MEEIQMMSGMDLAELRDAEEDQALWRRMTMTVNESMAQGDKMKLHSHIEDMYT